MSPRFAIAVNVAMWCLFAQLFLQLAAFIFAGFIVSVVELEMAAMLVTAPVGAFTGYVGLTALQRAKSVMEGRGPIL